MGQLGTLWATGGATAQTKAAGYGTVYAGDRAAMVVDVVASRRRRYSSRVRNMILAFRESGITTLATLAAEGPGLSGLRRGEAETMTWVAAGLLAWGAANASTGGSDDLLVADWATWGAAFDLAPGLDQYVGSVPGIGPALYTYLRMRAGGDGIKPDVRVRARLADLGFRVPPSSAGLLLVAWAAADNLGVSRLQLDQLLW
jgi:hypothetical protein